MPLIDAHAHVGPFMDWHFHARDLEAYQRLLGATGVVVSTLEGCEFGQEGEGIGAAEPLGQVDRNDRFLNEMKGTQIDFRALFWIRPNSEGWDPAVERFMERHERWFRGLKIHPFHSKMNLEDERIVPYLQLANRNRWVVLVHTAADPFSHPEYVIDAARAFPGARFIMGHMGLFTDNQVAIDALGTLPNLFGDTSWVNADAVFSAARRAPSQLLFGTDAPLGSHERAWEKYLLLVERMRRELPAHDCERVLWKNAADLFGFECRERAQPHRLR